MTPTIEHTLPRKTTHTHLTAFEIILQAGHKLTKEGKIEFTEWDLTVEAWKMVPATFGMKGHQQYPDHKRMYVEIAKCKVYGPKNGLFLEKVKPNTYRMKYGAGWKETPQSSVARQETGAIIARILADPKFIKWKATMAAVTNFEDLSWAVRTELNTPMEGEVETNIKVKLGMFRDLYADQTNQIPHERISSCADFLEMLLTCCNLPKE
jgi:hypothetical protein